MNPFTSLYTAPPARKDADTYNARTGITGRILHELEVSGAMTGADLALRFDLRNGGVVSALLASHIAIGRVIKSQGRGGVYELSSDFSEEEAKEIAAARELLRRNGYTVTKELS